ncbi:MAG: hypothetical protein ABTQ30_16870, partial [Rhizobiaceae bacterium]
EQRHGDRPQRKPWEKGPRPDRGERPQGARDGGRPPRKDDGRRDDRPQKQDFRPPRREERPARIDPLSPFAKLAALRDQLKK